MIHQEGGRDSQPFDSFELILARQRAMFDSVVAGFGAIGHDPFEDAEGLFDSGIAVAMDSDRPAVSDSL
jgi:hypothetical protein